MELSGKSGPYVKGPERMCKCFNGSIVKGEVGSDCKSTWE